MPRTSYRGFPPKFLLSHYLLTVVIVKENDTLVVHNSS